MTSFTKRAQAKLYGARSRPGAEVREFASIEAAARLVVRMDLGKRIPEAEVVHREAAALPWRAVPEATWRAALAVREPVL